MPELLQTAEQAQRAGLTFTFISGNHREATLAYMEEFHITQPVYFAPLPENQTFYTIGLLNTPFYCYVDAQGIVRSAGYPSQAWQPWQQLTDFGMRPDEVAHAPAPLRSEA
ncbi:MAG: hypothetical protein H0X24_02145 [Ktedonobacterales bacterium]|nr:hypothetical protein [Ktedonobacterales bacterium]